MIIDKETSMLQTWSNRSSILVAVIMLSASELSFYEMQTDSLGHVCTHRASCVCMFAFKTQASLKQSLFQRHL